jgi:2-iminobutanoate/2-iminopropanoate deaminase
MIVSTSKAPEAIGPYSQEIIANGMVFASGQIPIDPASGNIPDNIEAQAAQSLRNLKAVLEQAGTSLEQVVKTTIFLMNMEDFATINKIFQQFSDKIPPVRSTVQVSRLPKDVHVEIEAIAIV